MKQKSMYILILILLATLLAACASPAPASTGSNVVVPTQISSTNSSSANSTSLTPIVTLDSSLACEGGKTSASQTVALTEGPYYKQGSPELANLIQNGMTGTKLTLVGYVYDTNCQPVANAWLDFWQADANGNYDNSGYTLRGHQYTDANGRYELVTVIPGLYPGRTEHIHFKVQAPTGSILTSQLFFPGVTQNSEDGIYEASLLIVLQQASDGMSGQYNFVVPAS